MLSNKNNIRAYGAVMFFFTFVFTLISFVNHYFFRTYAFDLGLYNNAIYDYAHLHFNYSPLLLPDFPGRNQLSDHFDLLLIILSPLGYIFGTYTLLFVQLFAILLGGLGIARFVETCSQNSKLPVLAMIHFFTIWGIYSALSFDYHSNVVATMGVPWLFLFIKQNAKFKAFLIFIFILICKENMALWAVFLASGLALLYWKEVQKRNYCLILSFIAGVYFILAIKVFMPYFSDPLQKYIHFDFTAVGISYKEAIKTILFRPQYAFSLLFESQKYLPEAFGNKTELHLFVLLSGGFCFFFRPSFLWMLLPIYGQKMFNDDFTKWGINNHYSIEFAPIICISLFVWIAEMGKSKQNYWAVSLILLTAFLTYRSMENRVSKWYKISNENIFLLQHYQQNYDVKRIHHIINQIPGESSVSASCNLVPHLAFRKNIYLFPYTHEAEFILLLDDAESYYPINQNEFKNALSEIRKDSNYRLAINETLFYLFVRKDIPFNIKD